MNKMETLGTRAKELGCSVRFNEPMKVHTTFRIGGPADLFCTIYEQTALAEFMKLAGELQVPVLMLGNGSNMLVSDEGFRGAVVSLDGDFVKISLQEGGIIECGAAVSLAGLCNFAKKHRLTGLEFAWGIPGSAGGAAFMNAGAYGGEMAQIIVSCHHITPEGAVESISGKELDYAYRHSIYMKNSCVITGLVLKLDSGDGQQIAIAMEEHYNSRKTKQPLNKPSAGSVFKRPEGNFAGTLIEKCGLKGRCVGGAAVSEKHAGFIVNLGGATCKDVLDLIAVIQDTVKRETGVSLECEIKKIG